ncbi:MAG: gamma carbonic anhydrase family protein [Dehalococcoidales bacterium]|nr:gamma carbonic anhydrase family protein [Dehalococcoidales bacterium]
MLYRFDGREPRVGKESYVSEHAVLIGDIKVGDNCYVGPGAILRADYGAIEIGDGSAVEESVTMHVPPDETCWIGKKVTLGHGSIVHSKTIGDFAVIGMGAILSLWVEIGEHSIVAEGTFIKMKQQFPGGVVIAGSPAQIVRPVSARDNQHWERWKQLYIDMAKKYLTLGTQRIG